MAKARLNLVIGAGSGIAQALCQALLERGERVIAVSRSASSFSTAAGAPCYAYGYQPQPQGIATLCGQLQAEFPCPPARIFICCGLLHSKQQRPEKKLADIEADFFHANMQVNALLPLLWLQQLSSWFETQSLCQVVVFSARIGSIGDNQLGGWYSYRASKAALNMLLKTAAIELGRRFPKLKLISFHPGTTDTPLSKPFQGRVPAERLFSPVFVAERLLKLLPLYPADGTLSFIDWNNHPIAW